MSSPGHLAPHEHERKFFRAYICKVTFKHLPLIPQKSYTKFQNPKTTFENPNLSPNIAYCRGPWNFLRGAILIFVCVLGAHAKFQNPMTDPFVRKVNAEERERCEERKKIMLIVAPSFCLQYPTEGHNFWGKCVHTYFNDISLQDVPYKKKHKDELPCKMTDLIYH